MTATQRLFQRLPLRAVDAVAQRLSEKTEDVDEYATNLTVGMSDLECAAFYEQLANHFADSAKAMTPKRRARRGAS